MTAAYAGITVPDGDPERLEALGAELGAMAGRLESASAGLRGLPGALGDWAGPASVEFARTSYEQADATAVAAEAFTIAQQAMRRYGAELRDARREARDAIAEARDARLRIRRAEQEIDAARARIAAAEQQAASAGAAAVAIGATGGDPTAMLDERRAAQADAQAWHDALRDAVRRRDAAEQDLDGAQRRGRRAERAASDAEADVAGAYAAIAAMAPAVPALGGPAHGLAGGGTVAIPGADRFGAGDVNVFLTLTGGALTGVGAKQLQAAYARAERRYGSYRSWRGLAMTPEQEITVSRSRAAAGRAAQSARAARVNPLRTLGGGALVLEPLSGYAQFKANEAAGMDPVENAVRTGASSAGALGGGFAAGSLCAATGVGILVAGACGAGGAMLGSWVGDKFGEVVYWVGDEALDELGLTG